MKIKHIIIIFIIGYIFEVIGVQFKIFHIQGAAQVFTSSTIIKVIASILMIWKLIAVKDFKDILNS
ncbi:MAG: gliding motility protein GldL [Bacteroidales bacterium]|nr:gliding motility protein GldL [Bacteroidales bacterium]